ncbi:LOW QUALITY PROTEIN: meiosis-specific nuclear structural protein 1 [Prinia subflava]|uniref:LOW QUALITY PROTEIN: meiosis-specific nuclear structural protein 1 n=1 Tax=Prinia subflava TaxID=208062 RepID=UPI002FE2D76F
MRRGRSVFSTALDFFPDEKVRGRPLQGAATRCDRTAGGAAETGAPLSGGAPDWADLEEEQNGIRDSRNAFKSRLSPPRGDVTRSWSRPSGVTCQGRVTILANQRGRFPGSETAPWSPAAPRVSTATAGRMDSEEREWSRRAARMRAEMERERRLDEALRAAEENRKQRALQLEREQKLAAELARRDLEKMKDEKIRQQVRANSLELRELERKLKSAYMNKERAAQIAEKKAIYDEKMKWEDEVAQEMKEEYDRYLKEEMSAELRRNQEKKMYHQELDKQVEEQEKKKQDAYEEFLREKRMIDEIVKKIYEEDQMEKQRKLDKIRETQTYIEEFIKEQAVWRKRKQEEMEEENRKIMEFANMQRQREDDRMAKVRDSEEKKQRVQNMLAKTMEREEQRRKEQEQIRQDLYLEEQEAMERKKEMAEIEKRIRQRLDLRQTYEEHLALKAAAQQAMREEEEALRQQILAKLAEDDRVEQLNAQKRRMKQLEHKKAVEKILEDRRKQCIAEKERELQERELEKRRQESIRAIIEEERQKLLKEHAWKLLGYLPRGILKDENDINMLGEDFRLAYQQRRGNELSEES